MRVAEETEVHCGQCVVECGDDQIIGGGAVAVLDDEDGGCFED